MMRLIVEAAPEVCSVPNTRWPVSAAVMADADRRQVAHFADQHHVRVLTQRAAQGFGEVRHVHADFALHDDRFLVLVVILDRVFHRDDVPVEVLVDVVDHRRQRGRLARTGRPGDQEHAARAAADLLGHRRQADLLEGQQLVGNSSQHQRAIPFCLKIATRKRASSP